MTNTKQELTAIRNGAPDGTTHCSHKYMRVNDYGEWEYFHLGEWSYINQPSKNVQSLDDIRAQIELMEQNEKLEARVAELEEEKGAIDECGSRNDRDNFDIIAKQNNRITELERENNELEDTIEKFAIGTHSMIERGEISPLLKSKDVVDRAVKKFKLEQQAKGVEDAGKHANQVCLDMGSNSDENRMYRLFIGYANKLRNSAKGEL